MPVAHLNKALIVIMNENIYDSYRRLNSKLKYEKLFHFSSSNAHWEAALRSFYSKNHRKAGTILNNFTHKYHKFYVLATTFLQ